MDQLKYFRSAALLTCILFALIHSSYSRYHGKRIKRQNGAHMYLPESFIVPNGEGEDHEWSDWSSPSTCSRSCGGGVSFQTRECLNYGSNGEQQCKGGSRKYFSCNSQDCPDEDSDFRAQQCSRFDSVPFDGVRYQWVPYTNAPNPCELNCMPRGERFYYRHKAKVIDGTRCNDKTLDVCVDGECRPVGCDMMLGSNAREDKCRKCAGDGSSCKTISGSFDTNDLAAGYNDILLIPTGATNIVLKEKGPSNNYLACRNLTGHYYLNGNWRIDFPRPMLFAGSWWHYQRKPTGFAAPDQLTCSGPTTETIYIVMLIQDRNVGVKYEYSIPENVSKNLPDTYSWTHMEFGPCSVSCGGGTQSRNVTCNNRLTLEKVDETLCDANTKPTDVQICGTEDCAPRWVEQPWGKCSNTCGKDGTQNRTVSCERISPNGVASIVDESVCLKAFGSKPTGARDCNRDIENCPKFHKGPWTPCNTLCGKGKRTRKVTCFKEEGGKKKVLPSENCSEEKPDTEEDCMIAPCKGVDWVVSQWSGCTKCGQVKETRTVLCASEHGEIYDDKYCSLKKPDLVQDCNSTKCKIQWFTSQWSECSAKCGKGIQSRIVICGEFDGLKVTTALDESKCNTLEKPSIEQNCEGDQQECPGEWFTAPWGKCSKDCGGGQKNRKVFCLANSLNFTACKQDEIKSSLDNCNTDPCTEDNLIFDDANKSDEVESLEDCEEEIVEGYLELKENLQLPNGNFSIEDPGSGEGSGDFDQYVPVTRLNGMSASTTHFISSSESSTVDSSTDTTIINNPESSTASGTSKPTTEPASVDSTLNNTIDPTVERSTDTTLSNNSETTELNNASTTEDGSSTTKSTEDLLTSSVTSTDATQTTAKISQYSESSTAPGISESTTEPVTAGTTTEETTKADGNSTQTTEDLLTSSVNSKEATQTTVEFISSSESSRVDSSTDKTPINNSETTNDGSTSATPTTVEIISSSESSTKLTELNASTTNDGSTEATPTTVEIISSSESSTNDRSTEATPTTVEIILSSESSTKLTELNASTTIDGSTEATPTTVEIISSSESSTKLTELNASTTNDGSTEATPTTVEIISSSESSTKLTELNASTTNDGSTEATPTTVEISSSSESSTKLTELNASTTIVGSTEATPTTVEIISSSDTTSTTFPETSFGTSTHTTEDNVSTDFTSSETTLSSYSSSESSTLSTYTHSTDKTFESSTTTVGDFETSSVTIDNYSSETTEFESTSSGKTSNGFTENSSESTSLKTTDSNTSQSSSETSDSTLSTINPMTTDTNSDSTELSTTSSTQDTSEESTTFISSTDVTDIFSTDLTTVDIWNTEEEFSKTTPNSLNAVIKMEQTPKPKKCKLRKQTKVTCESSKFGCCRDMKTFANGPFGLDCPVIKTCSDSEFGCCLDGLSPSQGKKYEGCPTSLCAETLFGCCLDGFTPSEGEDYEGCPSPTTISPSTIPSTTILAEEESEETTLITDMTESSSEISTESISTDSTTHTYDSEPTDTTEGTVKPVYDEKDCNKSLFGCCKDKKTPARGPNDEGCALCSQEPYGCCPDGSTPAHGELGEGCCLKTQFGCCPDNINAAMGPDFEGCACKDTPFGCCPDNTTTSRGYNNEGCGCESSTFGCCPDKLTPALGPKFTGCPCQTLQFGCCPDGITIAQGPHHYGCHCSQTQFKCCSDEKTPAKGPNNEGCTCAESKFGCCPDGMTEALGSKFENCTNIKESPQRSCGLPKDQGRTCTNYTIKFFFDTSYGACNRFWYGGCDGNGNRFESDEECKNTCQDYSGKDKCLLPKISGPCPGTQKKWYFDSDRNRCEEFNYGGCYGTSNRFDSLEECKAQCSVDDSLPICEQPMDKGPCEGKFERWFYDNETDICRPFIYGGCKGNKNNYVTEHACNYNCRQPGVHKEICSLNKESGNCGGSYARWHYSDSNQKCLPFYYSGCGGNKNNFRNLESCEENCPKKIAKDVCEKPAEVGECRNYTARWYWDTKDARCRQYYYGGCGGNENNFEHEYECIERCEKKPQELAFNSSDRKTHRPPVPTTESAVISEEKCFQPAEAGDCDKNLRRWFYNFAVGICEEFIYTGCRGNNNNFASEGECEISCFKMHSTCLLPALQGHGSINTTRWHYDERSKRCFEFRFNGQGGNRNNFINEQDCMDYCSEDEEEKSPSETASDENECNLPLETGSSDCKDNISYWYYNKESQQCENFYYTGCNGNENRFERREQCEQKCINLNKKDYTTTPSVNECESAEYQCHNLQCPFGVRSEQGLDGCQRCDCFNPCAEYACSSDEKCTVEVSSDPSSKTKFEPICRQINKNGICPKLSNSSECRRECYDDADCRDDSKCCSEGCKHICVRPYQSTLPPTTLTPSASRTETILPGESAASLEPKSPKEVEVTSSIGSTALLRCFATGNPPPVVTWRRGAILIDTNNGRYILSSSGDLSIVQVHQSDSGSYICVATNGLGTPVTREINLQVPGSKKHIPAYIHGPKNVTQIVALKQPAVVRCPAGGYPKPHVNWWRGKTRMPYTTHRYDTKRDYSLVFRSIEISDLGPYECSAWTGHGKPASKIIILKAVGPVHDISPREPFLKYIIDPATMPSTSIDSLNPPRSKVRPLVADLGSTITSPQYRKSVSASALIRRDSSNNYTIGSDVVLTCDVEGNPTPSVAWHKDNKQLFSSNRVQITENPYRLLIYKVTAEDSGYYKCTARNTFSFNTSEEKVLIESGEQMSSDCTDNIYFANCALIVKGRYCSNAYYRKFCCRSCTLAGQLPGMHPNFL